jgi:hypothetical protein
MSTWAIRARAALRLAVGLSLLVAASPASGEGNVEDPDPSAPLDPAASDPEADAKDEFDPFAGVDRDGRIPKVALPDDLPNPSRWRYIPEGRIKPGNLFQRFLVSSFIAPFAFRSGDVGWGGGIALTDIDFRAQRRREFAGAFLSYTDQGPPNYTFVWRRWLNQRELLEGGVVIEERSLVRAYGGWSKTLTRRFYGFGAGSGGKDETSYSDRVYEIDLGVQTTWPDPGDDLILRAGLRGEFHRLGSGSVGGKPDTKDEFEALFNAADPTRIGWLSLGASWDTRDSQVNPYSGWEAGADVAAALAQRDADLGAVWSFRSSKIFQVPGIFHDGGDSNEEHPPTDTLAFGSQLQLSSGEMPFFSRPTLGGARTLRGFIDGRFRGNAAWTAGVEHRVWVITRGIAITDSIRIERIGVAGFYELGSVAENGVSLFSSRVQHSYGFGLRATLERIAPFRLDFGFSKDGMNITAGFGLSF